MTAALPTWDDVTSRIVTLTDVIRTSVDDAEVEFAALRRDELLELLLTLPRPRASS